MTTNNRSNDTHTDATDATDRDSWAARIDSLRDTAWPELRAVSPRLVQALDECVTASGILEKLAEWRHDDTPRSATARTVISDRAILAGLLLLSAESSPLRITELADLFENRLDGDARQRLGIPAELGIGLSPARKSARWVDSSSRAFHRLVDVVDPFPQPTFRPMNSSDIAQVLDAHDSERETSRKARLDEFTQLFLSMTFAAQPPTFTDTGRRIDVAIADRFIPSGSRHGFNRRSLSATVLEESFALTQTDKRVVDIFAGWNPGQPSPRDHQTPSPSRVTMHWGRMATMAVRVGPNAAGELPVPAIVVSATLRMPMTDAASAAVTLMRGAARTGLRPGIVHADLGYFSTSRVDKLHKPAYDLGFTPVTDYRREHLGVNGAGPGARWVEGQAYCSEMPALLVSATIDYRLGAIDKTTYRNRLEARHQYGMRVVGKPTKKGTIRMVCAARHFDDPAGTAGTAGEDFSQRTPADPTLEACTRAPVSLNWDDALRNRQAFAYGSAKWLEFYSRSNRAAEAANARLSRIESPASRGVLGFAAAQVFMTMNLTTYNLREIARHPAHEVSTHRR